MKSPNRKGEHLSMFKWEFNFCKQEINYIASQTNQILEFLDNKIQDIVESFNQQRRSPWTTSKLKSKTTKQLSPLT